MLEPRIQQHFVDSADLAYQSAQVLGPAIESAVHALVAGITSGAKVLVCASPQSHALAERFALLCVTGFERERPALAALALGSHAICARQIHALGQPGDVLLVVSAQPANEALCDAVQAAHEREMTVVALLGAGSDALLAQLRETDVPICVAHERAARVHEVHTIVVHCLCDGVDLQLLGEQENFQ